MFRVRGGLVAAAAVLAMVSCTSSDGNGGLATVPTLVNTVAPPTSGSDSTVAIASTTTTPVEVSTTSPSVTLPPGIVGLSADGPWRLVDSAPGVTTPGLVYELMPKLWAFIQVQETDQSTYSWTLNEADRPIIEAYLNAELTYSMAVTSSPIDLELPGWQQFYADGGAAQFKVLEPRRVQGQVADLDLGVVLQPQVLSDERTATTAIVAECMLDGGVFRMPDGSLASGSTSGVVVTALAARMELVNGRWLVGELGSMDGGCP